MLYYDWSVVDEPEWNPNFPNCKPSLSMKILSINNFTVKLLSEHKKKYTVKLGDLTRLVLKHISDCLRRGFLMSMYCDLLAKTLFLN